MPTRDCPASASAGRSSKGAEVRCPGLPVSLVSDTFLSAPAARRLPRFPEPFGSRFSLRGEQELRLRYAGSPKGTGTLGSDRQSASGTPLRLETLGARGSGFLLRKSSACASAGWLAFSSLGTQTLTSSAFTLHRASRVRSRIFPGERMPRRNLRRTSSRASDSRAVSWGRAEIFVEGWRTDRASHEWPASAPGVLTRARCVTGPVHPSEANACEARPRELCRLRHFAAERAAPSLASDFQCLEAKWRTGGAPAVAAQSPGTFRRACVPPTQILFITPIKARAERLRESGHKASRRRAEERI